MSTVSEITKDSEYDEIVYAGFDDMGNCLALIVVTPNRLNEIASQIGYWITQGLLIKPITVEESRGIFGRNYSGPAQKFPSACVTVTTNENAVHEGDEELYPNTDSKGFFYESPDTEPVECTGINCEATRTLELLNVPDWWNIRTLGDIDRAREEIARLT